MKKTTIKRAVCTTLACVGVFGATALFSGCTTKNPEVKMKLTFNEKTYTLEYKLYRKIAPATTTHFMELVEKKYYDGLCIHDFDAKDKMYTGGYTFDSTTDDNGGLVEKDYFAAAAGLGLTATVWADEAKTTPTYTLRGEFYNNGFDVNSGALKESYGALSFYYTSSKNDDGRLVYVKRASDGKLDPKPYSYNSATSLFSISLSSSATMDNNYCTFATLKGDSVDDLDKLVAAIEKYIETNYDEESEGEFAPKTNIRVDENDPYAAAKSVEYSVPEKEIRIQSIRITKY